MAILLYHETATHGMIATPADKVGGTPHPPRRYHHDGHIIVLDGPAHVIAHDAEQICKIPGYRLATSQESNAYYRAQRGETALREESAPDAGPENETPAAPESDDAPTSQVLTSDTAPSSSPRKSRKG